MSTDRVDISRTGAPTPVWFDYHELEALAREHMFGMGLPGVCRSCAAVRDGCEPDAERYPCEECHESDVDGAEQLYMEVV